MLQYHSIPALAIEGFGGVSAGACSGNSKMEINYELNEDDLKNFGKQYAGLQPANKFISLFVAVMFYVFIFADLIYLLVSGRGNFEGPGEVIFSIFLRSLIGTGILGLMYLLSLLMQNRATVKLGRMQNNGILCEHRIVIDEAGFLEMTDVNTSKHSWLSVGEIEQLKDFVLVNVNFVGIHFIPKRYFEDREHIREFIDTATYHRDAAKENFNASHLAEYDRRQSLAAGKETARPDIDDD